MMLNQEELDKIFPKEIVTTRYTVGWYQKENREFVQVYDKLQHKIIYKSNSHIEIDQTGKSLSRLKQYNHIKKFYGKENCDIPKEVNPYFYEGF